MILKLILMGAVLYALYRFAGGNLLPSSKEKRLDKDEGKDPDSLEECVTCGTYVTAKESIALKGKIYCSKECLPN